MKASQNSTGKPDVLYQLSLIFSSGCFLVHLALSLVKGIQFSEGILYWPIFIGISLGGGYLEGQWFRSYKY